MNQVLFKGSRRGELGRRLADRQRQPDWHFGPRHSNSNTRSDPHLLVKRLRSQVAGTAK